MPSVERGRRAPGDTCRRALRLTPSSPRTADDGRAGGRQRAGLAVDRTVTFFGVVTASVRPPRPSGWEREAESTAPSARMPRSVSAASTVVAVVQYSVRLAVDGDGQLAAVADRDVVAVVDGASRAEGTTTSCGPTAMSCLSRTSATVDAEDVHRGGLPVDGDLHGLVVVGHADRTGGHDEGGGALGDVTKGSREQHRCSMSRAPRAPASDVSRQGGQPPAIGAPACVPTPPAAAAERRSHVSSEAIRPRPFPPPCRTRGRKVKFR